MIQELTIDEIGNEITFEGDFAYTTHPQAAMLMHSHGAPVEEEIHEGAWQQAEMPANLDRQQRGSWRWRVKDEASPPAPPKTPFESLVAELENAAVADAIEPSPASLARLESARKAVLEGRWS